MGCYINPKTETKEAFLSREGTPIDAATPGMITETHLPVCLVNNGPFNAAAIAFSDHELRAFQEEDGRERQWFLVPREELRKVSFLKQYE